MIWDGQSRTANRLFGENYWADWRYAEFGSLAVIVGNKRYEVGDEILVPQGTVRGTDSTLKAEDWT